MNELPARCREVVELLSDYLDGVLSDHDHERVATHLQTCPDCTAYVEQLRTTIGVLGLVREENVPEAVLDELVATFRGWKSG